MAGDVLFYRDRKGQAVLRPAAKYRVSKHDESDKATTTALEY